MFICSSKACQRPVINCKKNCKDCQEPAITLSVDGFNITVAEKPVIINLDPGQGQVHDSAKCLSLN